jgi:hypothetical protein
MAMTSATSVAALRINILQSVALLTAAFVPWPQQWTAVRTLIEAARSPELNRAEREIHATGYYEGLIGGGDGPEGARGELALRLMGKPNGWVRFNDANVARHDASDFLQFELIPSNYRMLFGQPFVTNTHGMHSPEVSVEKPEGTVRIALLGASMDMGWGVNFLETYSHRLENWLNRHARQRYPESVRRFEVLNFAVAAYSPLQRLETLRRKAMAFRPDLVIFSATMLDLRLMEIHLCDLIRNRTDLKYDFVKRTLERAGVTSEDIEVDANGRLILKDRLKQKLQEHYWDLYDQTLGAVAGECRTAGVPLVLVIVPRVGKADAPKLRAEPVARLKAVASHHAVPVYDLSDTFDKFDPTQLEIAAWDDHPNALGHRRLFLALARALVKDEPRYRLLFPDDSSVTSSGTSDPGTGDVGPREPPAVTAAPEPLNGKHRGF